MNALRTVYRLAVKNPKSTLAGLSALIVLIAPEHKTELTALSVAVLGILSGDSKDDPPAGPTQ